MNEEDVCCLRLSRAARCPWTDLQHNSGLAACGPVEVWLSGQRMGPTSADGMAVLMERWTRLTAVSSGDSLTGLRSRPLRPRRVASRHETR